MPEAISLPASTTPVARASPKRYTLKPTFEDDREWESTAK